MAIEAKKKANEPSSVLLYRFNKMMQQSGVLKSAKRRRFVTEEQNRRQRRASAIYRAKIKKEIFNLKKSGALKGGEDIKFIKKILRNPKKQVHIK